MTFLWTRSAGALTSTCVLCGMTTRSLSEAAIYLSQRGHTWQECARRRAEVARVVEPEDDDIETCPEGHKRAGNTSHDSQGYVVCLACNRAKYAARKASREGGGMCCGGGELGVAQGRLGDISETAPSVNSKPPLNTPVRVNGKESA